MMITTRSNTYRTRVNGLTIVLILTFIIAAAFCADGFSTAGDFCSVLRTTPFRTTTTATLLHASSSSSSSALSSRLLEEEAAKALARAQGEEDTIARGKEEEVLLETAPKEALQEASLEERQAAIKANKQYFKQQQRLGRGGGGSKNKGFGGGGGGFGGAKSTPKQQQHIAFDPKLDKDGYAAILRTQGVARKNNVLCSQTTKALRDFIDDELIRAEADVAAGKISPQARFARVLLKHNRWDMSLPFEREGGDANIVMQALYELLGDGKTCSGAVGNIVESALSADAKLHELASLISDPGSDRQILHPDVAHQGNVQIQTGPPFVTCFCALQNVDRDMGPTEFLPETNTEHYHELFNDVEKRDDMLKSVPVKLSLLKEGDASLYDTTTLHAGTANRSSKRRRIFYFTFRSVAMDDDRTPDEPGSIRGDVLERKLSLKDVRQALRKWKRKQEEKNGSE